MDYIDEVGSYSYYTKFKNYRNVPICKKGFSEQIAILRECANLTVDATPENSITTLTRNTGLK